MPLIAIVGLSHPHPGERLALGVGVHRAAANGIDKRDALWIGVGRCDVRIPRAAYLEEREIAILLEKLAHRVFRLRWVCVVAYLIELDLAAIDTARCVHLVDIELITRQNRGANDLERAGRIQHKPNRDAVACHTWGRRTAAAATRRQ